MSALQNNPYIKIPDKMNITDSLAEFAESVTYGDLPEEVLRIGKRCILDGLGLYVAGTDEPCVQILIEEAEHTGGRGEAFLLGRRDTKVPAAAAARVLGTSGHAHDWDDSQVSLDPDHVYGLLTHPTIPPLTGVLTTAQMLGGVSGKDFLLAFLTGFEAECKISEWMFSQHYKRGFHSSGTVGTFGSYVASAKLLELRGEKFRSGLGIAASMASGIRVNFGTMTKPLHVGRAGENGVTAASLAARGFEADLNALDGIWGYFAVQGGGITEEKISQGFAKQWSIVNPGVSIKPYPCGVLTHPTMDAMLRLVKEKSIMPENIEEVRVYAGSNILNPIRYAIASNHLEAKFCLSALVSMIAIRRQAGKREFKNEFICSKAMQDMQRRVRTVHDQAIEDMGFDKMRSRVEITLKDGSEVSGWADERYRGGPENPLTDEELAEKVRSCCTGILDKNAQDRLIETAFKADTLENACELAELIQS